MNIKQKIKASIKTRKPTTIKLTDNFSILLDYFDSFSPDKHKPYCNPFGRMAIIDTEYKKYQDYNTVIYEKDVDDMLLSDGSLSVCIECLLIDLLKGLPERYSDDHYQEVKSFLNSEGLIGKLAEDEIK